MAISYTIQAHVVDIAADAPRTTDAFLVDSNVWYWMTYPNAGNAARPYQLSDYPQYVNRALAIGSRVCHTGLSLAELSHLIEKTEREIYEKWVAPIESKEYRHNLPDERSRIVKEVQAAWGQVKGLAALVDVAVDDPTTDAALVRLQNQQVDGYDLFILEAMTRCGITQVLTDDGDFATVPGIQVFTSNRTVLQAASSQGRMLRR